MHLIPRRRMRRVLVLLMALSGLLAVPALAFAHSDLSLVKVVDHAQAAPGDLLTYTIVIQNHGTHANAPGTMTDTLPPHTTFVSATNGCAAAAGVITCPVAPLAVGSSISITITVRVDDDVPAGTLRNVADVTAPGDTPTDNNHGEAITTVGLAGPGRLRLVGSESRRAAGRRRAGPRRRHGAPVRRLRQRSSGTTTTDASGFYRFDRLRPGTTYAVCLDNPADSAAGGPLAGFELTVPNAGSDDSIDSDGELRNGVPCIASAPTGAAGSFIPTYDFGFWKPAAIGDRVWEDTNHNGIQDAGEHGVGGVGVALHDSSGATIAHAVTDANGLYLFDRLPPGTYNVCFEVGTIPSGFSLTTKDAPGSTRANGSDAGADGCAVSTVAGARPARSRLGRGHLEGAAPPAAAAPRPRREAATRSSRCSKVGKPATVRAGEAIHYTLVVTNVGKATAHGVKVCDTLPDGLTVTSTGGGKLSGAQVCWTVGGAPQGQAPAVHAAREGRPDAARGRDRTRPWPRPTTRRPPAPRPRRNITLPRSRHGVAGVTG